MSGIRTIRPAVLLFIALATPALAQRSGPPDSIELNLGTTLATPPLRSEGGFECAIVNVSRQNVLVGHVKIIALDFLSADTSGCKGLTLSPHALCEVDTPALNPLLGYCEIVILGNADTVRGALTGFRLRGDIYFPQTVEAH